MSIFGSTCITAHPSCPFRKIFRCTNYGLSRLFAVYLWNFHAMRSQIERTKDILITCIGGTNYRTHSMKLCSTDKILGRLKTDWSMLHIYNTKSKPAKAACSIRAGSFISRMGPILRGHHSFLFYIIYSHSVFILIYS